MSIIFFRFFLLFSVVANRVGPKTRYHRACSRSLTSLVLSRSLRFAAKILYEIMLVRIFCNFSFFFTQFFWLMGWVGELFWGFLRFQLLFSGFFSAFGLILGAVLKVLWIIAPQDLPTMLSTYGYCTLCYANRAIIRYKGIGYASQI